MTDNIVPVSETGPNQVHLRPVVTAGAPVAPSPGVADDTPMDQQEEQRLIDSGVEDTAGPAGEDTTREELDANDAVSVVRASDTPRTDVIGSASMHLE